MSRYIEIYQTLDITELEIIKSSLNHHNIDYTVYDENTLYSSNIYAMGFTGARIMIEKNKHAEVIEILINLIPEKFQHYTNSSKAEWVVQFERIKSRIPVLKSIPTVFILIGLAVMIVAIISIILLNH